MTWEIREGDVLTRLRELPDASVHCVVTSPPYWGLRDYKIESQVWGGFDHTHLWQTKPKRVRKGIQGAGNRWQHEEAHNIGPQEYDITKCRVGERAIWQESFCACGAWRGSLGLEPTPELFVSHIVEVFREVKRVLRSDGTLWLNMGDSYTTNFFSHDSIRSVPQPMGDWSQEGQRRPKNERTRRGSADSIGGLKPKDLCGIPWRVAFALQVDGWYLRSDIIWAKPNPMPESVTDRPTKAHEYVFLLAKSPHYFYDQEAVRLPFSDSTIQRVMQPSFYEQDGRAKTKEFYKQNPNRGARKSLEHLKKQFPERGFTTKDNDLFLSPQHHGRNINDLGGRNLRTVWTIPTQPYPAAHFATYPEKLVEPCIKVGTSAKGYCPTCGNNWEREVSVEKSVPTNNMSKSRAEQLGKDNTAIYPVRYETTTTTRGWYAPCDHGLDPLPCTVLDPFCGSGTTGEVTVKLGRSFIGIELNPTYCELARKRIGAVQPLFDVVAA